MSKVVGLDLVPVMNIEISHVNVLPSGTGDHHPIQWHRDDYPYACILMLSETNYMAGGETLLRTGLNGLLFNDPPKMVSPTEVISRPRANQWDQGFAYILHGRHIEHAVRSFDGCTERITAVTSFRPRSPFIKDQTQLSNVRGVSDHAQLYFQFVQYRWHIAIERLAALKQILNGEGVHGWILQSPSLGKNLEDIRHFLRDTSTQIGLPTLDYTMTVSSKVNDIDLTITSPVRVVNLYSTGLRLVIESLIRGLQEQETARGFDRDLAQSTFEFADNVLLQLIQE